MGVVRVLCELPAARGVKPGDHGNAALVAAAQGGHVDVVRYLCELPLWRGVGTTAREQALARAVTRQRTAVVRYLCELPRASGVRVSVIRNAVNTVVPPRAWGYPMGMWPQLVRLVRYLTMELPAGDAWLDSDEAEQWEAEEREGGRWSMPWLLVAVQRRRVWRRRRSLLLLRRLADTRRGHSRISPIVAQV